MRITTRALARLTPQEIRDLRYVFDLFSSSSHGSIAPVSSSKSGSGKTTDEDASKPNDPDSALIHVLDVRKALRVLGFNLAMDQVRAHVNDSALDTLPADHADFNTFLDIVIDLQSNSPDYYDDLVRGFEKLDLEKRGRVSLEDLKGICEKLSLDFTDGELTDMIAAADTNGDGYVDLNEFIAIMRKTHLFL